MGVIAREEDENDLQYSRRVRAEIMKATPKTAGEAASQYAKRIQKAVSEYDNAMDAKIAADAKVAEQKKYDDALVAPYKEAVGKLSAEVADLKAKLAKVNK